MEESIINIGNSSERTPRFSRRLILITLVAGFLLIFFVYLWSSGNYCYLVPDVHPIISFSPTSTLRYSCFYDLSNGRLSKNCERISSFVSAGILGHYELDKCYDRVINSESDPSICFRLNSWDRRECITLIAIAREDPSICTKYISIFNNSDASTKSKYLDNPPRYYFDSEEHVKKVFSLPGCLISSGKQIDYDYCDNLSNDYNKEYCYELVAEKIKTSERSCESILSATLKTGDIEDSYLECIKVESQKKSNLSICHSCEDKGLVGCNEKFISNCYLYSGLTSGKVEPCFYKNNLFSITYNSSWNYFLDCYMSMVSSGSSPFTEKNQTIVYLKNYCSSLDSSPEKSVCDATVNYLADYDKCVKNSSTEYSFNKEMFDFCIDSVVTENNYYDYYFNTL